MIKIIFIRHGESTENIAREETGKAYDPNNIILTTKGEEQAKKTGKYLSKTFGNKFDCVISSPITRCVQTSNIIMEQINFNKSKIIINDLIMEIGAHSHPFDGLSVVQREELKNSDKQIVYRKIEKDIDNTTNPYTKYYLNKKFISMVSCNIKPSVYEAKNNLEIFMDELKNDINKNNYVNILVVSHGGILSLMQKIICGIDLENQIYLSEKKFDSSKELLGNCACLYLGLVNNKFILVAPASTYHLV